MTLEEILEDVITGDDSLIVPDELQVSDDYMEDNTSVSELSKARLLILKRKLSKIIKLNTALNKFGYGYVNKDTEELEEPKVPTDWGKNYHYLSPEEFERVKGGVCWDYAEYQYRVLRKAGYQVINFYIELSNYDTHTFTVVKSDNYYIYLESSYQTMQGVYVANHVADIFNTILNNMVKKYGEKTFTYEIRSYAGYDNYGCSSLEFMDHMRTEKLVAKGSISSKNPLSENLRMFHEESDIDQIGEEFFEGYVVSKKDIYYNKDKFDSGEINLCFITGLSGSGKSTMAHKNENDIVEAYELDHVVENWNFSNANFKEYGDLIYSFFTGVGKRFKYDTKDDWWKDPSWDNKDPIVDGYEVSIVREFVNYAKKYAFSHKDKKIIIEGIYLYQFIKPSEIDEYAVYIKGTSVLISKIRAAKRDSKDAENKKDQRKAFVTQFSSNWKYYLCNEKNVEEYRKYFSKKVKESDFSESADVDEFNNYFEEGDKRNIKRTMLNEKTNIPEKYKKHLRLNSDNTGIVYYDNIGSDMIGFVNTEEKENGVWIQALEVSEKHRQNGYGKKLMLDAMKTFNAEYLSVRKSNSTAISLYKSLGFDIIDETDYMYAMSTNDKKEKVFPESYDLDIFLADLDFAEDNDIENELLLLEGVIEHSFLLQEVVEKKIFSVLATPEGRRKYKRIQDEYINRNMEKLSTAGPMYLIVFGDNDQKAYFDLFDIKKEEIIEAMKKITQKAGANSDFKFLRQNPILVVLYFCIRYFTLEKDEQGINATLGIFALGIYWSKFTKYFPKGVIGPVMDYTIDNMTEKFMVKKCGNIFNTLMTSIRQSYQFHKKRFYEGGDDDVVAFLQRISNDQNSLLKKIANEYMKNYKEGNAVTTRNDDYDPDNPIVDDVQNASTIIQNQVSKVTLPIISNGVDLVLAEAAARMSKISISDCREYLVKIMVQSNLPVLESLIESILFMFIYTEKKTIRDIKSQYFLVWAAALFRKTNSKDENLRNINAILEKWAEESGIYDRYKREGSRINYKKGIFFYVILSIQKYS